MIRYLKPYNFLKKMKWFRYQITNQPIKQYSFSKNLIGVKHHIACSYVLQNLLNEIVYNHDPTIIIIVCDW